MARTEGSRIKCATPWRVVPTELSGAFGAVVVPNPTPSPRSHHAWRGHESKVTHYLKARTIAPAA